MNPVRIGVTLPQFTDDPDALVQAALRAEEAGLDSVWLFDHLWPLSGGKSRPILECWTTLAWIAAATARVEIGTLVTRSSLRHPIVAASMARTVAAVAPGRLTVVVGSGDELSRRENEAFGLPYWPEPERYEQLRSTVSAMRSYLGGGIVEQHDAFVDVRGLPAPAPDGPSVPVWVAGRSDEALTVAAEVADGYNVWGRWDDLGDRAADLRRTAPARTVAISWAGTARIAASDEEAAEADVKGTAHVTGSPARMAGHIHELADAGASHVMFTFPDAGERGPFERLGEAAGMVAR